MSDNYLPAWATADEACAWLARTVGGEWSLPRLLEHGVWPSVWLDWTPGASVELFGDRREGFMAPFVSAGDTQRLAFDRTALLTVTMRPGDGAVAWVTPGIKVPVQDLRFPREFVERAAARVQERRAETEQTRADEPSAHGPQQANAAPIGRPFTLWESRTITVGELLERIAESLYSDPLRQAGVVLNLREKVKRLAMQQAMPVRNSLSLEVLPVAAGDGLWNGVLFAKDAQRFAQEHGVPVTVRPHGSGPTHWTLELAAAEIGSRLGWHEGSIRTLVQRMVQAAQAGDLRVRDPHTDLRIPSDPALLTKVREYYELVTRDDVNEWLATERAGYSWEGEAAGRGLEIPDPLRGLAEAAPSNLEQPVPHEAAASTRPPQRQRWQEGRILATLRALGYEPCALPVPKLGSRDGPKARCRKALRSEDGESTWTDSVFDKAWERCRAESEIRDAD